jgi:regulator of protease activity HflC (stomatin/prohibitin superfamily)
MTLTIDLPPDLEKTVRQQAAKNGQDVDAFVLQAVNEKLAKARTFDEICAPFAEAVAATGVGDDELDDLVAEAREDAWQEKQGKKP